MKAQEMTITRHTGNWTFGRIGEYDFEVKHWPEASEFGIDMDGAPGRISKLWIGRRSSYGAVACYDRGWDKLPRSDEEIEITQSVIDRFN